MHVLIVEDGPCLAEAVRDGLRPEAIAADGVGSAEEHPEQVWDDYGGPFTDTVASAAESTPASTPPTRAALNE
jgi:hypothetical protein